MVWCCVWLMELCGVVLCGMELCCVTLLDVQSGRERFLLITVARIDGGDGIDLYLN